MQLSPRLKLIADLVKEGSVVADIGTDHGYIPVYCVKNGISPSAIAMDVNPMPLAKAEENIAQGKGRTFTNQDDMNAWLNAL